MSDEEMIQMKDALGAAIAKTGKIRLLVLVEGFRHMDPDALLESLTFALDHAGDIERFALVASRIWIKSWVKLGGFSVPGDVKYFDRSEMDDAWSWLGGS